MLPSGKDFPIMPSTDPMPSDQRPCGHRKSGDDADANREGAELSAPFRLQTAQDVTDLLSEQIEAVRADPEARVLERARLIGQLAAMALKAIETGTLAARLDALEAILKRHPGW
jgi:hypothetical protein